MKERLLGGTIGTTALAVRDKYRMMHAAFFDVEQLGTITNDQLATRLVTRICLPRKKFIDVGSHIGSIISEVRRHDPSIEIIAIEAMREKALRIHRQFPFVELHACAAGEFTGEVSFFVNHQQSGYSSLVQPEDRSEGIVSETVVQQRRLDELFPADNVDVVKIDVEGAELGVLRGAATLLTTSRPIIMFESGPQKESSLGYTNEALYAFLTNADYAILVPNRVAHRDRGLTLSGFLESHVYPRRTTNYFAIPHERHDEVRERARRILGVMAA